MAKSTFDFVSDPSHGWLKVPMAELERLGIVDQISIYSYVRGDMAYLEEDDDAGVFKQAREARNEPFSIKVHSRNKQSRIRSYQMFGGDRMVTRKNALTGAEFQERADTPYYCSPSSETYWCQ
jgi:hypothetical protein